jgi:hypothetical protein
MSYSLHVHVHTSPSLREKLEKDGHAYWVVKENNDPTENVAS